MGEAGFSPHRDRQPDDVQNSSFRKDGSPKYSTCWVALSERACPENSCLYVVPRWSDPGYSTGDLDDIDPLQRALPNKEAFQAIRAVPLSRGGLVMFTHRVLHWGSKSHAATGFDEPRMALSFAAADDSFEPSYFDRKYLPYPPLHLRIALISAQMIVYNDRFQPSREELRLYFKSFDRWRSDFHPNYVAKVVAEYLRKVNESDVETRDIDNELDSALDAILDAEAATGEYFHDDFDELDSDDEQGLSKKQKTC
mgnify:CR=1 FL=1